ncbi:MAG: BTAD domain-containing putative transcriptional regulator [Longimicrobiaceae bacterium]
MKSFRLKLFGGAALEGEHGALRGRAAHRRRIALLALLAAGRGRTVARERVIGLLWPETDGEAARHLLSESLYVLRKALGEGALVSAGDELGVDPAVVACDVAAFEEAIAADELETAVELYAGPFLDGFYVSDAPEFERWAEGERSRFARTYARALQTLAERREAEGEWTAAVEWWRRLFAHDPFSSRVALRLMTALDAAGERAAALKVAATHAALMREELEAEPEPAVLSLAERLRTDPAPAGEPPGRPDTHLLSIPVSPRPASGTDTAAAAATETAEEVAAPATNGPRDSVPRGERDGDGAAALLAREAPDAEPAPPGEAATNRGRKRRRLAVAVLVAVAVAAAAVVGWAALRPGESAPGVTVAVFSYEAAGGSRAAPVAAGELQALFSSAFTLVPGLWTVDAAPPAGARGWREVPSDALGAAARARGARYAAILEVLSAEPLRITVSVREVRGWSLVAREISAPGEPPGGAVQRIGLKLARAVAEREDIDVGPAAYLLSASDSAAALGHFMLATSSFRAGDTQSAVREFRSAVAADPLCLLAYHRLSVVEGWSPAWRFDLALQVVDSGLAHREQGRAIDVQLLEAQRELIMRRGNEAVQRFTRLTVNDESLLDGWFGKGEAVFHFEGMLGGKPEDALSAFEQVVRMDSTFSPVYEHLAEIAVRMGDRERARRYARRVRSRDEAAAYGLAVELRFGGAKERARALAALETATRNTVSNVVRIMTFDPATVDTLGALMMRRSELDERRRGAGYRLAALTAQGRWPRALEIWKSVPPAEFDKWIVHAHLVGYGTSAAAGMLREARAFVAEHGGPDFSAPLNARGDDDPFRALVHQALLQGDSADVSFLMQRLDAAAASAPAWNPEPGGMRATLRARQALLAGDTAGAIRRLQEALERAPWWVSSYAPLSDAAPERLLLARLLLARGRAREAEVWLNSFGNIGAVGDLVYAPAVRRLRAHPPGAQGWTRPSLNSPQFH